MANTDGYDRTVFVQKDDISIYQLFCLFLPTNLYTSYPDGQVLAGGLHDNCRAVVAGATSFGKGTPNFLTTT